ncbi:MULTISPECIES: class I SAM-dependent methyltransferase [unclassified Clostridium]|uniref:class I SAM-dependent methyltransferase n=1 Tax=unclassified Clostridium TaxID=2614128 RepID=UPI000ED8EFCE|nr:MULTISPECIES: class I SAM-dependent methyltransferase [unclassified Clostridium]HCQ88576.1 class I SAM-dependent methyltransferase [Clostridium sp.]
MINDLKTYLENMKKPWSALYYRLVWEQLPQVTNCKVLDFGSGLGITANHLAKNNDVVAIEPDAGMIDMRICENNYKQIIGNIEQLKEQDDDSFDVVICHNVFEYAKERKEIFRELYRVLKPNGIISIVKHNHTGRVIQKVVFENNIDEAISLLDGGEAKVMNFGQVDYYNINDVKEWIDDLDINIEKVLGVRTFFALQQNNEIKYNPMWQEKMFEVEMKVCDIDEYRNISFYNHILLRKLT